MAVTEEHTRPGGPVRHPVRLRRGPCDRCVEACLAGALTGDGRLDKKTCGNRIFAEGGFRAWRGFLADIAAAPAEQRESLLASRESLDAWQNFMTGIYYPCWACQAACPAGQAR